MHNSDIFKQEFHAQQLELEQSVEANMASTNLLVNDNGQAFIEFLFILLTMVLLSFGMLKGMNNSIAQRWLGTVKAIAKPTPTNIELR
ncbi:hypothetical protein [Halobacteriovorax sp. HLS]|uniref:hypothetical protein n=1 Tax=Halobacteriovorax sp. HLS TaxID=2234000 RepID=UPI000FD8F449|nr:hypothetical protein [Halobacteriovorax sp. HLS]